jgi:hypothetical protein
MAQHTLKGTSKISWKSAGLGASYLEAKLRNAMLGSIVRFSGFIYKGVSMVIHYKDVERSGNTCTYSVEKEEKILENCMGHLTLLFNARTASLCSQISEVAVNSTHRIGTECLAARAIHLLRTSASGFVLSVWSAYNFMQIVP